jgi:hypothetical protein
MHNTESEIKMGIRPILNGSDYLKITTATSTVDLGLCIPRRVNHRFSLYIHYLSPSHGEKMGVQ